MTKREQAFFDMLRIRMVEEEIARRYHQGKMRCPVHLSIGQEAAAVGVCMALGKDDKMVSTHRGHAHYLAKGGKLVGLIGELYGKRSGCAKGNGGSMHLIDLDANFWGSTSIVGGAVPVGVGLSFADRIKGSYAWTTVCIGDAAVEEGVFHEASNFAALHNLNVIFVCENNLYSCYTHIGDRQPSRLGSRFKKIADGHNLRYYCTGANDLDDIHQQTQTAMLHQGPSFIEIPTYRHLQHCGPDNDDDLGYRPKAEIAQWRERDPVRVLHHEWVNEIQKEIDKAFTFVENDEWPTEVGEYVFAKAQV